METSNRNFWLGCALWGYKPWVGNLFPPKSSATDFLKLYSERFTAVEGNTTFYSTPDAKAIARWVADTPVGFQFCPKLSRQITHQGSLQAGMKAALQFVERMQGLGDRLGPIFAQLPPGYSPEQWDDLMLFLTELAQTKAEIALEVRHLDWFQPLYAERLNDVLTQLQIGRVLLDTRPIYDVPDDPQLTAERKKPKVPVTYSMTAPFSLIRYISHPDWVVNCPFLQDWLPVIDRGLQTGKRIYFFVHCPVEERSPNHARSLQQLLEQQKIVVPALPWNQLEQPPIQLNLL